MLSAALKRQYGCFDLLAMFLSLFFPSLFSNCLDFLRVAHYLYHSYIYVYNRPVKLWLSAFTATATIKLALLASGS